MHSREPSGIMNVTRYNGRASGLNYTTEIKDMNDLETNTSAKLQGSKTHLVTALPRNTTNTSAKLQGSKTNRGAFNTRFLDQHLCKTAGV